MSVLHTTADRTVSVLSGGPNLHMTHGPLSCEKIFIQSSPPPFYTGGIFHGKFQLDSSPLDRCDGPEFAH